MSDFDYCRKIARSHAYADYLCALTLAPPMRRRVLPLIALDVELRLVAVKVGEEMLAHIRYAWWREHIAERSAGHPVLRALSAAPMPLLVPMIGEAQEAWPAVAKTHGALQEAIAAVLADDAKQLSRWRRAQGIAVQHGTKWRPLLALKLAMNAL